MGQSTKSTQPKPPHTSRPHGRVNLAESKHDSHRYSTRLWHFNRLEHGRVTWMCNMGVSLSSPS
ncbi:hypothetical protein F383_37463 [Gossypium arboreum]|uniref:Uncharacterized protein n=1 Tax=Gossypium arboreum TaxID=29729 RepID=A0A0B0MCU2_GOSAR|nr:hypothetical protein F383_37463 [Gossypium arboreum]